MTTGSEPPAGGEAEALARYRAASRRHRADPANAPNLAPSSRRRLMRSIAGTPSGPRPDARDPQRVGAVWRAMADTAGWTNEMALWSLTNRWAEIVGPQVAEHVKVVGFDPDPAPEGPPQTPRKPARRQPQQQALLPEPVSTTPPGDAFAGGRLMLAADSNSWQQQMIWNLVHLQRRLDEELGSGVVGSIVVLGPQQRRRRYG